MNTYVNPHLGDFERVLIEHSKSIYFEGMKLVNYSNNKEYLEELMQEGRIGLFEAYKKYDPNIYSVKFWSYAWRRVRGRMIDFVRRHSNFIKPTRTIENIINKIKKMDQINWDAKKIAEAIDHPIIEVKNALEFLRIKNVDSLNRAITDDGEQLVNLLPDAYDYFERTEDKLWSILSANEQQFLHFKLQNYNDTRIQREMCISGVVQNELELSLKSKAAKMFYGLKHDEGGGQFMTGANEKLQLTKAKYSKHKKNNMVDKDVCKNYGISKSTLIKLKAGWGISNSRSTVVKEKTLSISSTPKEIYIKSDSEEDADGIANQSRELKAKIIELEGKLREAEDKLRSCEYERDALWRIQDILRARCLK